VTSNRAKAAPQNRHRNGERLVRWLESSLLGNNGRVILYRSVGLGMAAFSHLVLRPQASGRLQPGPGTLYLATHRSELDVPFLCGMLYPQIRRTVGDSDLPWFAVRDDLFLRGWFAHFAPWAFPLSFGIGPILRGPLRCVPVRAATRMRVIELARSAPSLPIDELPVADALRARAARLGRAEPRYARDVLSHRYADLLWTVVDRDDAPRPPDAWAVRLTQARQDLSRLVDLLRNGQSVLLFPEGRPSEDGAVAPLQRGVGLLVRRGRPRRVVPLGIAYDPIGRGRTRALLRIGEPVAPPRDDVEASLHELLCRTMPRSTGAAAAFAYQRGVAGDRPPGPPDVVERLAREYESAAAAD
jgi:1-acyl-sn-glycerol-3-phosphate acyltransferase